MEPEYIAAGNEFGDQEKKSSRPKWMIPTTDFQRSVLAACGRRYWPDKQARGREIRLQFILIERAMMPLASGQVSEYPREWVDNCLEWFAKKNKSGYVPLQALLTLLKDEDRKNEFVGKWKSGHKAGNYATDPYGSGDVGRGTL